MAQGRSRPAWAEIDLAAVTHNARVLSHVVQPSVLCAVVKAHGYGHGAPAVAKAALAGGATGLAVALVDEGVELRQHGVTGPILLLSECGADAVDTALAYRLTPTLYSHQGIEHFARASRVLEQRTSAHVKVDTGMHRVGASAEEVPALIQAIADDPFLRLEGMWTHLPVADGETAEDRDFTLGQLATFDRLARQLLAAGFDADIVHAANTAGAIAFPSARYGMVRCGIGLYGYLPGPAVQRAFAAASAGVAAAGHVTAGPGGRRAHAARRRPSLLRPPAPAARAFGGGHRAHRVRRRRAARPVHGRVRRADRGPAPAPGRHGHHGPDRGRLRRRPLGAAGRRGRAARAPG